MSIRDFDFLLDERQYYDRSEDMRPTHYTQAMRLVNSFPLGQPIKSDH